MRVIFTVHTTCVSIILLRHSRDWASILCKLWMKYVHNTSKPLEQSPGQGFKQANNCKASSTLNWQNKKQNRHPVFCDRSATIPQHFFFFKYFCNPTESRHRSVEIKGFLFCWKSRYLQTGLSAVWNFRSALRTWIYLTNRKCSTVETRKLIYFVFTMLASL